MEDVFGVVHDVGGYTGKGNGQTVEVDGVGIARTQLLYQCLYVLTLDKAACRNRVLAKGQTRGKHVGG